MKTADKLMQFRQQCEREAGVPVTSIKVPLTHALFDICNALKLPKKAQRKVLGKRGYQRLEDFREFRAVLVDNKKNGKHKEL